jgi:hypothetical protein
LRAGVSTKPDSLRGPAPGDFAALCRRPLPASLQARHSGTRILRGPGIHKPCGCVQRRTVPRGLWIPGSCYARPQRQTLRVCAGNDHWNDKHAFAISRHVTPELCLKTAPSKRRAQCYPKRGAGKTGCALHPRSRVQKQIEGAHEHTGSAEAVRPSLRNGFTAYFELSPVTGFLATVATRKLPRNLTPASGRQDHTTSPSASRAVRQKRIRVHRISSQRS